MFSLFIISPINQHLQLFEAALNFSFTCPIIITRFTEEYNELAEQSPNNKETAPQKENPFATRLQLRKYKPRHSYNAYVSGSVVADILL